MKTHLKNYTVLFLFTALLVGSCKKKETVVAATVPGNEFITTVKIRFQNMANATDTSWAVWKGLTPNGTNLPDTTKAVINLKVNTSYRASVYFLDETKTPATDITSEIKARQNYHLYVMKITGAGSSLTITATDRDTNNPPLPVGLDDTFITSAGTGKGRLEGILRHQPNGKNGSFAPGSTDSDVFFTLNITQ